MGQTIKVTGDQKFRITLVDWIEVFGQSGHPTCVWVLQIRAVNSEMENMKVPSLEGLFGSLDGEKGRSKRAGPTPLTVAWESSVRRDVVVEMQKCTSESERKWFIENAERGWERKMCKLLRINICPCFVCLEFSIKGVC